MSFLKVEYGGRRGGSQWLAGRSHVRIRFWKTTARRLGNLRDDDWPGSSQNRGFPAMRGPRAEARVGAVDEASTAAREGACAPRDQPRQRMAVARFHWK